VELVDQAVSVLGKSCDGVDAVTISIRKEVEKIMVAADPDQLKQVFWNLGLNAIQAMPSGGRLMLAIRCDVVEDGSEWAVVEFTDTGRGIPLEEVDRIFDPFYTTRANGTGLGLAITRKIVDHLGGRIEVSSREGKGTTFRVFLKRAAGEPGSDHGEQGVPWDE
jgi:signal transduction histidine kinase